MSNNSPRDPMAPKVDSEQNLLVAVRVRPINEEEIMQGATPVAYAIDKKVVVLMDPQDDSEDVLRANRSRQKNYAFDVAFDGAASQKEVYEQTAKLLIPSVIQGYNATVFAYGATGAGKTYTMLGTDEEPGIMARSLNDLFLEMNNTSDEMAYRVTMSYLEIYNEMIRDLLNPAAGYLELREDSKGATIVAGLSHISAKSTREVMAILSRGNRERTCEPTAANKHSSRSHAILQITIKQRQRVRSVKQEVREGCLFLIDLAGSERAANTHNKGKRMVEGAHINRSLLALGNCINALCDKNGARYVNYRDSKLTRILKEALGGNCRTVMIAHVSPASNQFDESRNTLVYADRAKNIKTKVRRNVMDVSYHIAQYTNIISELREEVNRLRVRLDAANKKSVGEDFLRGGNPELDRLKEQLLDVFREQMDLRRNLMDMNNTAMEISLDYTRSNLVIKKWEREKALSRRFKTPITDGEEDPDSSTFLTEAKARDLKGEEIQAPPEVDAARQELSTLQDERMRTEGVRADIQRELSEAKHKAAKIEEMLPRVITHGEQQEVLSLLCKVHELEIENMEMQSACLLRNFELRKKDLVLMTYEQHRALCDDIITQQRALLTEQQLPVSKELDELYELFQQESGELALDRNFSLPDIHATSQLQIKGRKGLDLDSVSDLTIHDSHSAVHGGGARGGDEAHVPLVRARIHVPSEVQGVNSVAAARRGNKRPTGLQRVQDENKTLFSHSPRAKEMLAEQARAHNSTSSLLNTGGANNAVPYRGTNLFTRQDSIITLSNSTSTSPAPPFTDNELPNIVVRTYSDVDDSALMHNPEKRKIITTRTRNIAALAHAKRRTKNQSDAINTRAQLGLGTRNEQKRTFVNSNISRDRVSRDYGSRDRGDELTQSRLAEHNSVDIDSVSYTDSRNAHRSQALGRFNNERVGRTMARGSRQNGGTVRKRPRPQPSYQQLGKSTPRSRKYPPSTQSPARKSRLPAPSRSQAASRPMPKQNIQFNFDDGLGEEVVEMRSSQSQGSSIVQQQAPEKGRGHTLQRTVRGPASKPMTIDASLSKSPQGGHAFTHREAEEPTTKPTIPVYATADIGITGFSLQ